LNGAVFNYVICLNSSSSRSAVESLCSRFISQEQTAYIRISATYMQLGFSTLFLYAIRFLHFVFICSYVSPLCFYMHLGFFTLFLYAVMFLHFVFICSYVSPLCFYMQLCFSTLFLYEVMFLHFVFICS